MISGARLRDLVTLCGMAGLSDQHIRAMVLQAQGRTYDEIREALHCRSSRVGALLREAHQQLADWQVQADRQDRAWARSLWHLICQDVEDVPGEYRPAAISHKPAPERPTDDQGMPILPPVRPFDADDLVSRRALRVERVLTRGGDG